MVLNVRQAENYLHLLLSVLKFSNLEKQKGAIDDKTMEKIGSLPGDRHVVETKIAAKEGVQEAEQVAKKFGKVSTPGLTQKLNDYEKALIKDLRVKKKSFQI